VAGCAKSQSDQSGAPQRQPSAATTPATKPSPPAVPTKPYPGITGTWQDAYMLQQAVDNGHQPWQTDPAEVVRAYAQGLAPTSVAPVVRAAGWHTYTVLKNAKVIATVKVTQPIRQGLGGIWVITSVHPA